MLHLLSWWQVVAKLSTEAKPTCEILLLSHPKKDTQDLGLKHSYSTFKWNLTCHYLQNNWYNQRASHTSLQVFLQNMNSVVGRNWNVLLRHIENKYPILLFTGDLFVSLTAAVSTSPVHQLSDTGLHPPFIQNSEIVPSIKERLFWKAMYRV